MAENNITTKQYVKLNKVIKFLRDQLNDINIAEKKDNLDTLEYICQIVEIYYCNRWKKSGHLKKRIVFEVLNFCDINFLNKHLFIALSRICKNKIINLIRRKQLKKNLYCFD